MIKNYARIESIIRAAEPSRLDYLSSDLTLFKNYVLREYVLGPG